MNKFIEWESLDFKKINGKESLRCPSCDEARSDKRDKSLKIDHNNGIGKCFYCEALTFRDSKDFKPTQKQYTYPTQEWRNYTKLSDKLVKWFWDERRISQNTLNQFEISEEKVYQPAKQKELNSICFNYFECEKLVNKKYRSSTKDFTQHKGGKPIFYNINSIIGFDKVYIVEGEMDVLALYEVGIKNVISLPNGANDNDEYWINSEAYLKDVKHFVIAVDNDDKGIEIRDKIAQRLGRYRCTFIDWMGKDANDDLKSSQIENSIKNEKRFSIGGTFNSMDLLDETLRLYNEGMPKTIYPKNKMFGDFNKDFSIMMGQLTVVTGIPSHGKSSFIDWYALNLVNDYNYKLSIYSPEHNPLGLYNSKYATLSTGKPFFGKNKMSEPDLYRYTEWLKEKLYFTTSENGMDSDWDWLLDKFKEQMFTYGINMFIIDAWNKVLMPKGMSGKDGIDNILTRLTSFCIQYNVHVFLVAHPTKMKKNEKTNKYDIPDLYSVSGSSDFRNQTHNGLCVYREFPDENSNGCTLVINLKTKYDFQGNITSVNKFNWNNDNRRFFVDGSDSYEDFTVSNEIKISALQPNLDFDNEVDCPF
jgi:twinkle protein